ncbi:unnamed protein product [Psylliodes chrysocephalus]|uniref:MADF domain-containing protein n=1 Tax=Psylliodes chrysocephalus TaxID=3402493 RepID=A0A9P0GCC9_9CUCU|nr:unnamed protein product [Psylliodes chrysocephala]
MEWNNELSLKLIDEYEKCRLLWDPKNFLHFNRQKKQDAWITIAINLSISVLDVKQKISNLLGSFRREKAKGTQTTGTGKGVNKIFLYFQCENIDENIAEDHVSENIDVTLTGNNETGGHASSIIENPVSVNNETDKCHTFQSPKPKRNKISTKNSNSRAEEAYLILKETVACPQEPADPCSVYGAHVGNKLKTYSPRTRVEVEHAINQILYAADRGKYETSPMNAYARMD